MRSINTSIDIDATPEKVWSVLTDFESYPEWNPFIKSLHGDVRKDGKFTVLIQPVGGKSMTFKPKCLDFEPGKLFRWQGHLLFPGIFDGEHIFELERLENGNTRFTQLENFKGLLVGMLWKQLDTGTRQGFEQMNLALKGRAEALVKLV